MSNHLNIITMEAKLTEESYKLVLKMANKFAHGNTSLQYEELVSAGTEGLIKAINNYKEDSDAEFSTFANACIRNAMCTRQGQLKRFDLQQDENVVLDGNGEKANDGVTYGIFNYLAEEMGENNVTDGLKMVVRRANKGNDRNAEIALLYFGLVDDVEHPMGYNELSAKFNLSAERVRQVCVNTIKDIQSDENAKEFLYSLVG